MPEITDTSSEDITKMLTSCAVKFMEGQNMLLNSGEQAANRLRRAYPTQIRELASDASNSVSELEKASRLIEYTHCEELTQSVNTYMKKCMENRQNQKVRHFAVDK